MLLPWFEYRITILLFPGKCTFLSLLELKQHDALTTDDAKL